MSDSNSHKIREIEAKMHDILVLLGLDLSDPSLSKTPGRVAKMYVEDIFSGLDPSNFPEIVIENATYSKGQLITVKNINFCTFCEHHLVPVFGQASVSYICNEKIIGLSNVHSIVRYFSKRPQLQERLTHQIAETLSQLLETPDVSVKLTAKHFCVMARSVEDFESEFETKTSLGCFKEIQKSEVKNQK